MVRRRMASPKASAPVRSVHTPESRNYAPPPRSSAYSAPTATPTRASASPGMGMGAAAPSQGPGLMAQMAATAGGVAIGSAVGHAVGNMMTSGGSSGSEEVRSSAPAPVPANTIESQPLSTPCEFEWKQFVECTQTQSDISLCQSLNEAFKQCRARYA